MIWCSFGHLRHGSPPFIGVTGGTRTRMTGATIQCLSPSATATLVGALARIRTAFSRVQAEGISGYASSATNLLSPPESTNKYSAHSSTAMPTERSKPRVVCTLAGITRCSSFMPASSGVLASLAWLHFLQAVTRFYQVLRPPRERGST